MSTFLFVVGVFAWLLAIAGFFGAPAITQQIASVELFVGGCVLIGAAGMIDAVDKLHTTVAQAATFLNKTRTS